MTYESFPRKLAIRWNIMKKEERKKKNGEKADRIEQSSGNVFADLGLNNPAELLHRLFSGVRASLP